mgnify:FL=1
MKSLLLNVMSVCLFGMLAVSCSQSMDEVENPMMKSESKKTQVMFTITLDDSSSRGLSNEAWSGDYQKEEGLSAEKTIKNLQVMLFSEEGDYMADMQNTIYYETSTKGVYEFVGDISVDAGYITTGANGASFLNAKMMVLANCSKISLNGNSTYEDVMTHSFAHEVSPSHIPMWGLQTVNVEVNEGQRNQLPAVDMLRAMAKVEVIMAAEGYTMENVVLNRYNTAGYCMPNISDFSNLANTAALNTENNTNYYSSSAADLTIEANNNKVVFYIPECENTSDNPLSMYVNITNAAGDNVDENLNNAKIYFKDYSDNVSFNVVRNHVYRYTISTINDNLDMELTCKVKEWEKETETWDFTENITKNSNIEWENQNLTINNLTGEVVIPNTNDYICTFELSTPVDGTWQASLIPVGGQVDAFEFVGANTGTIGTGLTTLTIKAKYEKVFNENNAAKLRIVVRTKDGRTLVANLSGSDQFEEYTLVQNVNSNN